MIFITSRLFQATRHCHTNILPNTQASIHFHVIFHPLTVVLSLEKRRGLTPKIRTWFVMSYQINILFNLFMCLDFENSRFTQKIRALSQGGGLPRKFAPALCHINLAFVLPFTCFDLEKYRFTHRKSERF